MLKDSKIVMIVGAVVLVLLVGGGLFFLKGKQSAAPVEEETTQNQSIPKLSKDEIGLSMELSPDNKKVKFSIAKAADMKNVDYEITYDADSTEDASVKVPKGITGAEDIDGSTYETDFLDLGTCSKNVCKYDTGIENLKLLLKITKKDGKVYQSEDSISVE